MSDQQKSSEPKTARQRLISAIVAFILGLIGGAIGRDLSSAQEPVEKAADKGIEIIIDKAADAVPAPAQVVPVEKIDVVPEGERRLPTSSP